MSEATRAAAGAANGAARRLGPRPLPLHLSAAALAWTTSLGALPLLRQGSPPWNMGNGEPAPESGPAALRRQLAASDPEAFAEALAAGARARALALLDGILAYRRHPYARRLATAPAIWSEGSTHLLDYGALASGHGAEGDGAGANGTGANGTGANGTGGEPAGSDPDDDAAEIPVLVVPSLINRAYILDLDQDTSLLRWLAARGVRPYLVDWDRPGPAERGFTLTDYIAGRLEGALDAVRARHGARPLVIGYCMGGLLALALALRRREDLSGLVLLATPWDFHAEPNQHAALAAAAATALSPALDSLGELPVDAIQALFASLDPLQVARKFIAFSRLDPASRRAALFVALEDWLNDGVPLVAPVARECLLGWYAENTPATGRWRVAGRPVEPEALDLPCLCLIPARDRIVPPASAAALGAAVPGARQLRPAIGHIGMIVSGGAKARVWAPLGEWLRTQGRS